EHDVLSGRIKPRESSAKLLPVLRRVHLEKRIVRAVVERPAQRQLASFSRDHLGDDWSMPRHQDIDRHIRLALDMDDFTPSLRRLPSLRREVLPAGVES